MKWDVHGIAFDSIKWAEAFAKQTAAETGHSVPIVQHDGKGLAPFLLKTVSP